MTIGVLGAILLAILAFLLWRDRNWTLAVVALLLGVVIAGGSGPLGTFAHTALTGLSTAGSALVQLIGKK